MLSSLSLCIPREFLGAFRSPLPLQVPESACLSGSWRFYGRGSPSGEEPEGESLRGGDMKPAGVNAPYHFGISFEKKVGSKISFKKQ